MNRGSPPIEVSNPRDFKTSLVPELSDFDSLLRCHICKDFLKTSVLTPCGHSFCSLCIRKYLQRESKCPLCLNELTESMLQKEFLVQEICSNYIKIRKSLLKHLQVSSSIVDESTVGADIKTTTSGQQVIPSRKRGTELHSSSPINKKKKNDGITSLLRKKAERKQKMAICPICTKSLPISALETTHIDDCLSKTNLERSDSFEILDEQTNLIEIELEEQTRPTNENSASSSAISSPPNVHTERYLQSGFQNTREHRLPRLDFQSLSGSQLKQKLSSLGLPVNGSKQQMINRYKHYEMIWNSNFLDSIEPVEEIELKRRLANWEAAHNSESQATSNNSITSMLRGNKHSTIGTNMIKFFETDRFDRKGWVRHHAAIFTNLKEEAKLSNEKAKLNKVISSEVPNE